MTQHFSMMMTMATRWMDFCWKILAYTDHDERLSASVNDWTMTMDDHLSRCLTSQGSVDNVFGCDGGDVGVGDDLDGEEKEVCSRFECETRVGTLLDGNDTPSHT